MCNDTNCTKWYNPKMSDIFYIIVGKPKMNYYKNFLKIETISSLNL